ncbi:MAG TPA: lytic transglycosylase domain-containing protein [Thermoanaerobaculia bacterium]|nr:lytic transglycosylase domain-containing protein [Thermoanaerobaculia bacterium]
MKTRVLALLLTLAAATPAAFAAPKALAVDAFPVPVPHYLHQIIGEASKTYDVDPNLIAAMAFRESAFKQTAVSSRGAQGVLQLMPRTARALGVKDAFDPRQNVLGGTKYIRMMLDRFDGNLELALAAYNAGPELVARSGPAATKEAVAYVAAVKQYYAAATR